MKKFPFFVWEGGHFIFLTIFIDHSVEFKADLLLWGFLPYTKIPFFINLNISAFLRINLHNRIVYFVTHYVY